MASFVDYLSLSVSTVASSDLEQRWLAAVELVAGVVAEIAVAVAVAAVLAAIGGVAEVSFPVSFPANFSAAKMRLDNYIVRSEGVLVFVVAVVVELGFEVASAFVTEVEIGLGPESEPGAMTADFVTAEAVAVVSVAEAEAFG